MLHVLTPVLGRNEHAEALWPHIRARAGISICWWIVVDGDASIPWHQVHENTATARRYADAVAVLPGHRGNGAAVQLAAHSVRPDQPIVILDADVLPSQDFARNLLAAYTRHPDFGYLGGYPHAQDRPTHFAEQPDGKRLHCRIALITPKGRRAIGDFTTAVPINGLDNLVSAALARKHLRRAYLSTVYVEEHPSEADPTGSAYNTWKAPYLTRP